MAEEQRGVTVESVLRCDVCAQPFGALADGMITFREGTGAVELTHKGGCDRSKFDDWTELVFFADPVTALRELAKVGVRSEPITVKALQRLMLIAWAASLRSTPEERAESVDSTALLESYL